MTRNCTPQENPGHPGRLSAVFFKSSSHSCVKHFDMENGPSRNHCSTRSAPSQEAGGPAFAPLMPSLMVQE